jgi:Ring hydroxylating alpha subunit (catalytic domain)
MKTYRRHGYKNFFLQSCESSTKDVNIDQRVSAIDGESSGPERSSRIAGEGNDRALYLFHYPNLCINRYGRWMDTNIVWPDGPDNCIVDFEWYAESETKADANLVRSSIADSEVVQAEDIMLCERVQKGLKSSAYRGREGRYSPILETGKAVMCIEHYSVSSGMDVIYFSCVLVRYCSHILGTASFAFFKFPTRASEDG